MGFNALVSGLQYEMTGVVAGLRLSPVHCSTLSQALADVPGELGLPSDLRFRVIAEGHQRELRASLWDEVYSICREAIVNAYHHSRATGIDVHIEFSSSGIRISVRDNGCGIDPQSLQRKRGWGLRGMRERADRIGARFRLLSRVASGTEVELCLPGRLAFP